MIKLKLRATVDRGVARTEAARIGTPAVTSVTRKVLNQAVLSCPVDTGLMRSYHGMTVTTMATRVKGEVLCRAKYARAVHDGSGPHTIRAKSGKVLRFRTSDGIVYRRSVRHPGSAGRPWMRESAERVAAEEGWGFTGSAR